MEKWAVLPVSPSWVGLRCLLGAHFNHITTGLTGLVGFALSRLFVRTGLSHSFTALSSFAVVFRVASASHSLGTGSFTLSGGPFAPFDRLNLTLS